MQRQTQRSWDAVLRLGKSLKWKPRYVQHVEYQKPCGYVNVYVDSDWAGEGSTRKSTSGGAACVGDHPVKTWASTQHVIALSSGEAEFYGIVRGSSIGLGLKALLDDLGYP